MKQKLDLEIVASDLEEQQIYNLIELYNLPYDNYYNPEDNLVIIKGLEIGEKLLLLLRLTGADIYTSTTK